MDDMTIEAFRRRLKTLKPDEATLERVSRTLVESTDERLKEPVVIEMVERFLLVSTDSPDEIGAERRLAIFINAGNTRVRSAVLGERGVKNAFIQKFGYGKYLDAAVSSGMMNKNERKHIEEANERMFEAAGRGDMAGIEAALNSGAECGASRSDSAADICVHNDGWTVAMRAGWKGHLTPKLVECLARHGCPMDARDKYDRTVAMHAAWEGHLTPELVECLVKHGCPMDARDNDGRTVAMRAAWYGYLRPELVEYNDGWTVAMTFQEDGCLTPELVDSLAKHGCPMDAKDNNGLTVAMHAAWGGILTPELVECLVRHGCPMDAWDNDGLTTVAMFVAYHGHFTPELVECLAKHGCPMDAKDNNGLTVAMIAAREGHLTPELVDSLVKHGCPMNARDNNGRTIAMIAAREGHLTPELVECLVRHGCPMDARDNSGLTVAMHATSNGCLTPELVECLAKHGYPMDARDDDGWTVPMHATSNGCLTPELVDSLVKNGCPMDDIDIGKEAAANDRFAAFVSWAKYAPGTMALQALDSFSNAKKRAAGALALLSSDIPFDEKVFRSLAETFSKSRDGAVEHLLGDKDIFRAIDSARFLELVCSGRVLEASVNETCARNLLSMCRSLLDERPEKLDVVKTVLSKTFTGTLEACADDPETAELLSEVAGRIAAAIEEENSYSGSDEMPCL